MKTAKRAFSMGLALFLLCGTAAGSASVSGGYEKEETIYAVLDNGGEVKNLYAVNSFELQKGGIITDYGDYSSVRNLTTPEAISYTDGAVTVAAPEGRFNYQGNLESRELPWKISISYTLDGEEISPQMLLGKSGAVEIRIQIGKNEEIREEYFDRYALQISLTLDMDRFRSIEAPEATLANAGGSKSITFTHLPGKEKDYTIKAEATDFQMKPISINGILLSMNIQLDGLEDMKSDLTELEEGIGELAEGTKKLEDGSSEYKTGLNSLSEGGGGLVQASSEIGAGISRSSAALSQVLDESDQLKALAAALSASSDPQVQALAGGYLAQVAALEQISAGLSGLSESYGQFDAGVGQLAQGVNRLADGYKNLHKGIGDLADGVGKLKSNTAGLDTKVQDRVDEMLSEYTNSEYSPVSFLSEKNTEVSAVQFVIRTEGFDTAEEEEPIETVQQELTFWQKLLKLFGLFQEE